MQTSPPYRLTGASKIIVMRRLTLILRLQGKGTATCAPATVAHLGFGFPCHSLNRLESYVLAVNNSGQLLCPPPNALLCPPPNA